MASKPQMTKVMSLSLVNPELIIGAKSVSDLKAISGAKGSLHCLAVRADSVDLADLDQALERIARIGLKAEEGRGLERESGGAGEGKEEKESGGRSSWEVDIRKLILKDVIGQGSFGTVHKGLYDGREVAVKLLHWGVEDTVARARLSSLRAAFAQEVAVWSTLDHPNVTQFIGASLGDQSGFAIPSLVAGGKGEFLVGGNVCCVVVEYMAGGTLKDYLIAHRNRKLPLKTVLRLALDISRGLEYLHSKRVVHRDTKTENLLMTKKGTVKITDFGVARVEAQDLKDMTGHTGTLGYMAPEVLNGKPYNHKADVYSFGICLWEIYVCDMPFPNLGLKEMAAVVNQGMRPHIPKICPEPLAAIMRSCWDKVPANRPSMRDVTTRLQAIDWRKGSSMVPIDDVPVSGGCFCFSRTR